MATQGVRYLSTAQHDGRAARFMTATLVPGMDTTRSEQVWNRLRTKMAEPNKDRRVFSSEFFANASDEQVARILAELGTDNLWIAVTLRPLAKILPSQYQQRMQRQSTDRYDDWLHSVLDLDPTWQAPGTFWHRHRHDELIARWAERVGKDKMRVIVLDSHDHAFLPHAFERLLALEPETLASVPSVENRSLTAAEAELMRRFNEKFRFELDLTPAHYYRLLKHFKDHIKERLPGPEEERLLTPDWAIERANGICAEIADNIRSLGVPVHGDLDAISTAPLGGIPQTPIPPETIDLDVAAWFAVGLAKTEGIVLDKRVRAVERDANKRIKQARRAQQRAEQAAAQARPVWLWDRLRNRIGRS